ncbi:hypothetical protein NQ315_017516 [Exocentrus adspersus]|uniref:Uncharacterized protein n=1 Tax=Exocentrus adspersus TaxID=1586481 RepID=A0AAV8VKJ7_9CUCU|nr:hypothetical protein NQ315_017516 [Exocentrus adspersus]
MYKKLSILVCVFVCIVKVSNKPRYTSGVQYCFKRECPDNTFACEKLTRVSEDKKQLVSEIRCLDIHGSSLNNITTYEDNPFDPDTEFKGYTYSGSFHVSLDNDDNDDANLKISHKEEGNDKKSEVEDLNSS